MLNHKASMLGQWSGKRLPRQTQHLSLVAIGDIGETSHHVVAQLIIGLGMRHNLANQCDIVQSLNDNANAIT